MTSPHPDLAETLLARAAARAPRAARMARRALADPAWTDRRQRRLRLVSGWLAWLTPGLLLLVIIGSLAQNNSALVETLWEITALAVLLAGIAIAIADSGHYYVKPLSADGLNEWQEVAATSAQAASWQGIVSAQARPPCQFDLEIAWALAAAEEAARHAE